MPYIIVASVTFTLPFFYIVGFNVGNVTVKFFWYWLFQGLLNFVFVYFGQFFAFLVPSPNVAQGEEMSVYIYVKINWIAIFLKFILL